jgi:hypothetical protein
MGFLSYVYVCPLTSSTDSRNRESGDTAMARMPDVCSYGRVQHPWFTRSNTVTLKHAPKQACVRIGKGEGAIWVQGDVDSPVVYNAVDRIAIGTEVQVPARVDGATQVG